MTHIKASDHMFEEMIIQTLNGTTILMAGKGCVVQFLDGSFLTVENDGRYYIDNKPNDYITTSDVLELFINFLGTEYNILQSQIMKVPIRVFIEWLIVQAARDDGEDYSEDTELLELDMQKVDL